MTRKTFLTALFLAGAASTAGAQQAPIPPPKTVHPLPQPITVCRGCSDVSDDQQSSVGKYDEKKPGTIRPTVRPDAKAAKPKPKTKRKVRRKGTSAAPSTASTVSSKTEVKAKPKPVYIDRPAIGDPLMLPRKDSTKK